MTSWPARRFADTKPPSALDSRPSTWIETPASSTEPANESAIGTGEVSKVSAAGPSAIS